MPKPRGWIDRKSVHISNINRLTIVQPRELSHGTKSKFEPDCGISSSAEEAAGGRVAALQELNLRLGKLLESGKSFGISKDAFRISDQTTVPEASIMIEQLKNKLVNEQLFLGQVKNFVVTNKDRILSSLPQTKDSATVGEASNSIASSLSSVEAAGDEVEVGYLSTQETHNGGRSPVLVRINVQGTEVKCLLKPRRADIDMAVMDTFRALNTAYSEGTEGYPLPDYTIIQPESSDGWVEMHGLEEMSLWQFIEGKNIKEILKAQNFMSPEQSPMQFARQHADESPTMLAPLRKMAAIFAHMGIVDQHWENIVVTDLKENLADPSRFSSKTYSLTPESKFVPVDMEVRGKGDSLLDVSEKEWLALVPWERAIINAYFHDKLKGKQCITRIVLMSTEVLTIRILNCLKNPETINRTVEMIRNKFSKEYMLVSTDEVLPHFMEDLLNGDIPYLSEKGRLLYYGLPSRGVVVGTKKPTS